MSGIEIEVEGVKELQAELAKLARKVTGPMAMEALMTAARPLESAMRSTTAFADQTGRLRRSIGTVEAKTRGVAMVKVGARAPHAHLVEFGTKERHTATGKSTGTMPKRPFIRPAFDKTRSRVLAVFRAEIRRMVSVR